MVCLVCGRPATIAIHAAGVAPEAYCAEHAPVSVRPGDSAARAAAVEGAAHANAGSAAALYDLAAVRLRAGAAVEAAALARRAADLEPGRSLAIELLSEALEAAGDAAAAEEAARRALAAPGADGDTHALLARLLARRGDIDAALDALETGFGADPWSFECCRRAAILRIARGAADRALDLVGRYLATTEERRPEVIAVAPTVGPEAVPGAPPPATVASFPSELEFRESLRRAGARRSHVVAAARYQARILAGDALRALGRTDEAERSYEAAPREIEGVSRVLLLEAGLEVG